MIDRRPRLEKIFYGVGINRAASRSRLLEAALAKREIRALCEFDRKQPQSARRPLTGGNGRGVFSDGVLRSARRAQAGF